MDIKVLGTTFDVKAYPEEDAIFIALETGSIELNPNHSSRINCVPVRKRFTISYRAVARLSVHMMSSYILHGGGMYWYLKVRLCLK